MSKRNTPLRLIALDARQTKALIRERFDRMPLVVKQQNGLVAYTPTLPATRKDLLTRLQVFAYNVVEGMQEDPNVKAKILAKLQGWGMNVSEDTPLSVLQLAVRNRLKNIPAEILLEEGILGHPCTEQQALKKREEIIESTYQEILRKFKEAN